MEQKENNKLNFNKGLEKNNSNFSNKLKAAAKIFALSLPIFLSTNLKSQENNKDTLDLKNSNNIEKSVNKKK